MFYHPVGVKYDDNTHLIARTNQPVKLAENEYYALMVIDHNVAARVSTRIKDNFFDYETGEFGLECYQWGNKPARIFISKDFTKRYDTNIGYTYVVRIVDANACQII